MNSAVFALGLLLFVAIVIIVAYFVFVVGVLDLKRVFDVKYFYANLDACFAGVRFQRFFSLAWMTWFSLTCFLFVALVTINGVYTFEDTITYTSFIFVFFSLWFVGLFLIASLFLSVEE